MELRKFLLCSLVGLSCSVLQAMNSLDDATIQTNQDEIQMSQDDEMQQMQLLQQIAILAVIDFFEINVNMVCAILKEDFRDMQKVERLISKQVEQYVTIHLPKLLASCTQQVGITNPQEQQQFTQTISAVVQNMLPSEVQKYLIIERSIYKRIYSGMIKVPKKA